MEEAAPAARSCPQCGQPLSAGAEACAKCGRDEANPFTPPAAPMNEPRPREVDLDLWFALIVVIVVCVAVGFAAPGAGILLAMVFVPAMVRAAAVIKRKDMVEASAYSTGQMASAVLASAGISIAVWMASAVAFAAVCSPIGLVGGIVGDGIRYDKMAPVVLAFGLGGLAGLAVFFWGMKRLWPRDEKNR